MTWKRSALLLGLLAVINCSVQISPAARRNAWQTPTLEHDMEAFVNCPREGRNKNGRLPEGKIKKDCLDKNRFLTPQTFLRDVTLKAMSESSASGSRWNLSKGVGVRLTGYVAFIIPNFAGELCNCYRQDDAHTDTHVDLVVDLRDAADFTKHIIVEFTPRIKYLSRKRGLDWSTSGLRQYYRKRVTVEGWLLYDREHEKDAQNTHPNDAEHRNWRATCWEVHPVTKIELAR